MLNNKKVLMIVAHADDEIIIGWPIFQDKNIKKYVLLLSTDENNKERSWCNKRGLILKDICYHYNIEFSSFPLPSGFYKTPTRNASFILNDIYNLTINKINEIKKTFNFDYIFTHNPHGEYGHCDHRICFDIVHNHTNYPLLITDIVHKKNWPTYANIPERVKNKYYNNKIKYCSVDMNIYKFCENYYKQNKYNQNCWTHNREPWNECGLYLL